MVDPFDFARRQLALDRAATTRFPTLFERKRARMLPSPHAFLRGSAPLFYALLAEHPQLAAGPEGEGWLVGDMHLENVGVFRTEEERTEYALNDFDDATQGPWRLDVLRCATSALLAGRTFRATGAEAIALCQSLLDAYVSAAWELRPAPEQPGPIRDLVRAAAERSAKTLLDDRAPADKSTGKRRFTRGERYLELPAELARALGTLVRAYATALDKRAPKGAAEWEVVDAVQRVAGTGSLGAVRLALLLRGKDDEERIFELKEARPSACEAFVRSAGAPGPAYAHEAVRVVAGLRAMTRNPPRFTAAVSAEGRSFLGRKLFPQDDKLRLEAFRTGPKLESIVAFLGHVLGAAHARARTTRPATPWSAADVSALVEQSIVLAGQFEAIYLAYARLA